VFFSALQKTEYSLQFWLFLAGRAVSVIHHKPHPLPLWRLKNKENQTLKHRERSALGVSSWLERYAAVLCSEPRLSYVNTQLN